MEIISINKQLKMSIWNEQKDEFSSSMATEINLQDFNYLIVYSERIVNKNDHTISILTGKGCSDLDLYDDVGKSMMTRLKNRGAIFIHDLLYEKEGLIKLDDCDDHADLAEIFTKHDLNGIVFYCNNIKRALQISKALKQLGYYNWLNIETMHAIKLSSGKKAMIFHINTESD